MDIDIQRAAADDSVELAVRGRLDAESAGELRQAVAAEVRRGMHLITLDLNGVSFLSSAGIRVLFETQREARGAGGDCHVRSASGPVRKVLELTRLDRILMRPAGDATGLPRAAPAATSEPLRENAGWGEPRSFDEGGVRFVSLQLPPPQPLVGRVLGAASVVSGGPQRHDLLRLGPDSFALGLAAVADDGGIVDTAGEVVAACASVYHRPPRSFAAVDYLLGEGDLVPEINVVTGLAWQGLPGGIAAFEPTDDRPAVAVDNLVAGLLNHGLPEQSPADAIAVVITAEVHGLVAAELIRPLAGATPDDHPLVGSRAIAANWLCFSREPVHAGRTAIIVGIAWRAPAGAHTEHAAPLGPSGVCGHLHAVVFPHRPIRRAARDLPAVLADLTASEPLAVVHLMADDRPVLGLGVSELVCGSCWFAPLSLSEGQA